MPLAYSWHREEGVASVKLVFMKWAPRVSHIIQVHPVLRIMEVVPLLLTALSMEMASHVRADQASLEMGLLVKEPL